MPKRFRNRISALAVLALHLAACGGGGGGDSSQPPTNSPPAPPSNQAPVASAISSLDAAYSTQTVSVDASDSSDSDGTIEGFAWEQVSGPPVDISLPDSSIASFTVPPLSEDGVVRLRVVVTDDEGATGTATVEIPVSPAPLEVSVLLDDGKPFGVDDVEQSLVVESLSIEGTGEDVPSASVGWESDLQDLAASSLGIGETLDVALVPGEHTLTLTVDAGDLGTTVHTYSYLVRPRFWPMTEDMTTPATGAERIAPILLITHIPTRDGVALDTEEANYFYRPPEWRSDTVDDIAEYVQTIAARTKFFLEERTRFRGYKDTAVEPFVAYQVVAHVVFYEAIPKSDRQNPFDPQQLMADYGQILDKAGAVEYIETLGVQDVWLASYIRDDIQVWESNMSSPVSVDVSNSDRFTGDLPVLDKTYIVYGINYHRTQAEAIHNYGHQTEAMLDYIDRRASGNSELFWGRFVGTPGFPGPQMQLGRCGWTHMPPNTNVDYDYNNAAPQESDCEDWRPDGSGAKTVVNSAYLNTLDFDWPSEASMPQKTETQFYLWWMQNMPGAGNGIPYNDTVMSNWWSILTDWDTTIVNNAKLYVDTSPPTAETATIINNFGDALVVLPDGTRRTSSLSQSFDIDVEAGGSVVELYSCGWEVELYPPDGCRFIPYTLFSGDTWQIVLTDPAPRIILERISQQPPPTPIDVSPVSAGADVVDVSQERKSNLSSCSHPSGVDVDDGVAQSPH